ncbi:MAG: hypothetical protein VXW06_05490 [Pseudomonadota bacterium]|nr:hypothetical protein [Pseudomonadota bacterium]
MMNNMTDFFTANLEQNDPEIAKAIHDELVRQQDQIELPNTISYSELLRMSKNIALRSELKSNSVKSAVKQV